MGVMREIVCLDPPDSNYLKNEKLKIHALGPGATKWHFTRRLDDWLLANLMRFDAVIINGLWQYHSWTTFKILRKLKKRSPELRLPFFLAMPNGMLDPYFQRAKERRLKAIRNWIYWKLIENKVVNSAMGLLFTCETELLLARETFKPYSPQNEFNIGYGIQQPPPRTTEMTNTFLQRCPGLDAGKPYLLFLSRIHSKKGADLLIEAYQHWAERMTVPQLVIAGPGLESSFGEKLQAMAKSAESRSGNIVFTGMLTGDAKWGAFYGCEAFVLPSHQENFGIVVAEALACSKPVLISDQVNIWREIGGGGLVGRDTLEGVKELLKQWLDMSIDHRETMSENARKVFYDNFESYPPAKKLFRVLNMIATKKQLNQQLVKEDISQRTS